MQGSHRSSTGVAVVVADEPSPCRTSEASGRRAAAQWAAASADGSRVGACSCGPSSFLRAGARRPRQWVVGWIRQRIPHAAAGRSSATRSSDTRCPRATAVTRGNRVPTSRSGPLQQMGRLHRLASCARTGSRGRSTSLAGLADALAARGLDRRDHRARAAVGVRSAGPARSRARKRSGAPLEWRSFRVLTSVAPQTMRLQRAVEQEGADPKVVLPTSGSRRSPGPASRSCRRGDSGSRCGSSRRREDEHVAVAGEQVVFAFVIDGLAELARHAPAGIIDAVAKVAHQPVDDVGVPDAVLRPGGHADRAVAVSNRPTSSTGRRRRAVVQRVGRDRRRQECAGNRQARRQNRPAGRRTSGSGEGRAGAAAQHEEPASAVSRPWGPRTGLPVGDLRRGLRRGAWKCSSMSTSG